MDIAFMDRYMSLIGDESNENKYYISSDMLATYGVLSIIDNRNNLKSYHVKRYLDATNILVENIDYVLRPLQGPQSEDGTKKRGSQTRNVYMLTKLAFSTCLILSSNESKYKHYYLLLEKCIYHYNKQQLIQLSNKNKTLIDRLDELIVKNDRIIEQNDVLIDEVRNLRKYVEEIKEYLKQRAVPSVDPNKSDLIAILRNNEEYYIVRRQKRGFNSAVNTKKKEGYSSIKDFTNVLNAVYFCTNILEWLKKNGMICSHRNTFKLISSEINDEELVTIINDIFEERLLV